MRKNGLLHVKVAGILIAAVMLASCYAPLANQNGSLSFNIQTGGKASLPPTAIVGASQAVVLVVDSGSKDALAEILYLVSLSHNGGLSGSQADRLTTLAKDVASSGLVKIGGYPFFLVSLNGGATTGSFDIPGIPAGRKYFVKIFVLNSTVASFTAEDVDKDFSSLIQAENPVFVGEGFGSPNFKSWVPLSVQPVTVTAGASTSVDVTLGALL